MSFADPLREKASSILPRNLSKYTKKHPLERQLLQMLGEEYRQVDNNAWVRAFLADTTFEMRERDSKRVMFILADDVYHLNEAMLMDALIVLQNPNEKPNGSEGYTPVSVMQTQTIFDIAQNVTMPNWLYTQVGSPAETLDSFFVQHVKAFLKNIVNERLGEDTIVS